MTLLIPLPSREEYFSCKATIASDKPKYSYTTKTFASDSNGLFRGLPHDISYSRACIPIRKAKQTTVNNEKANGDNALFITILFFIAYECYKLKKSTYRKLVDIILILYHPLDTVVSG